MWQDLFDDLKHRGFVVIAVALDTAEAARPWIEAASPAYPALIDPEHRLAELFNFVNVPQATWIDEAGRIVRPPETAGAYEAFRYRNQETGTTPEAEMTKRDAARRIYYDAVRDWAANGADSPYVMSPAEIRANLDRPTAEIAEAHARFQLGVHLLGLGRGEEAARNMAEASRLHPESWAMWRQAAPRNVQGYAAGDDFWTRVQALGDQRYYPPPSIPGMP